MTFPDITLVLNAHREGPLLVPTLRSLADTALHAATKGLTTELVAVLDSPDAATRAVMDGFESAAFVYVEKLEVAHRSLGLSRNAGLAAARGAFTATVDGDDLYSFNYLAQMHATVAGWKTRGSTRSSSSPRSPLRQSRSGTLPRARGGA